MMMNDVVVTGANKGMCTSSSLAINAAAAQGGDALSIVIPFSAQLTSIKREHVPEEDNNHHHHLHLQPQQQQKKACTSKLPNDKSKGCPFPTCPRYGHAFSRAHDLKRHIARHDNKRKDKTLLLQQVNDEHRPRDDLSSVSKCTECELVVASAPALVQHMQMHLKQQQQQQQQNSNNKGGGDSLHIYTCQTCARKYINENKLKVHMMTHVKQQKEREHKCVLCSARFQRDEDYGNHMMREHSASIVDAQQQQQQQQQQSASQDPSNIVVAALNGNVGDINDDDDDDDDNDNSNGNGHVEDESDQDVDHHFLLEEMLLFRKDARHSTDKVPAINSKDKRGCIRCHYCFKTFKTKWTLKCHLAAHEGRYQFECCKCQKKFVRKSHYEGHVRSHETTRPYSCEQCGKRFKELKHRREHSKRKHPECVVNGSVLEQPQQQQQQQQQPLVAVDEQGSGNQAKFAILMPVNFPI